MLQRSLQVPVLVDFWAEWCGPCKQLSPVLERLAAEAGGAWVLAKVDVDSNQALSGQLQIQSIPTVLLALGGRLIQGFTGALPERDLRAFLEQVLAAAQQAGLPGPAGRRRGAGARRSAAGARARRGRAGDGRRRLRRRASRRTTRCCCASRPTPRRSVGRGLGGAARSAPPTSTRPQVLARAQAAPDDVAAQTAAADVEVLSERSTRRSTGSSGWSAARSGDERDAARTHLVGLFEVLDPEDPRVVAGRRALANALF